MRYVIQDVGDDNGLDILNGDFEGISFCCSTTDIADFFSTHPGDERVLVLQGALDRYEDEEITVNELLNEIA